MRGAIAVLMAAALLAGSGSAAGQDAAAALPGGASALQETHGDWQVACSAIEAQRLCSLSQEHQQQNGQRLLAVELIPLASGGMSGALVLPFGLHLDAGAGLSVDGQSVTEGLRFSTCLAAGCVVPFTLDDPALGTLRAGNALVLTAVIEDTRSPLAFSVPLTGFSSALERTVALLE